MSNLRGFNVMYDIEPIVIQQVKRIAAHLYTKDAAKAEEGSRRLENALLTPLKEKSGSAKPENAKRDVENVKGYAFEVALFNALATLGIPVLFGGSSEVGGPSTPGYDLVALNLTRQEPFGPLAICISTKCSPNQPFESDIQKLLSVTNGVRVHIQGKRC